MSLSGDVQTDFGNVVDDIGTTVNVAQLFAVAGVGSYNIYGDYALSGANLYISGVNTTASIQPRTQEDLDITEWGKRVEGDMVGYFKSGVSLSIGYRVSGVMGDYRVNALSDYYVGATKCYTMALLDTLNK